LTDEYVQRLSESSDWREFSDSASHFVNVYEEGRGLLEDRFGGRSGDLEEYYPDGLKKSKTVVGNLPEGKIIFGMFPNVVWDGDIPERNILFEGVVQWCIATIEILRKTPHHLCIRFHPSEATRMAGTRRLEDILKVKIPDLAEIENLTLISSSEKVDSYKLARNHINVGLIYDGTLCLEMTCLDIPVIAATNGLFTLDGIAYKPKTLANYQECLRNPEKTLERFDQERDARKARAYKFAYWLFKESPMTFTPLIAPHRVRMDYTVGGTSAALSPDQQAVITRLRKAMAHRPSRTK
jgi:hypothetical protein